MSEISKEDALNMVNLLGFFHYELGVFLIASGNQPKEKSIAANELNSFRETEFVKTAYSQGHLLIEVAADHLMATKKTLSEPAQAIAPWTCVRALLEASAISCWLLDPDITVKERVQRSFAFRYEGLCQQVKFGKASEQFEEASRVEKRIDDVESKALKSGFSRVENKRGKRIGIAMIMPSVTEIIKNVYEGEASYRLLSAITHAHPWILQQSSFSLTYTKDDLFLEKNLNLESVAFLCKAAIKAFARPNWYLANLFGYDLLRLGKIFDSTCDASKIIGNEERFWSTGKSA